MPVIMGPSAGREENGFKLLEHQDKSSVGVGAVTITVLHTPGHTSESCCFLLSEKEGAVPFCVFTGDTLLLGDVGRPDLACNKELKV